MYQNFHAGIHPQPELTNHHYDRFGIGPLGAGLLGLGLGYVGGELTNNFGPGYGPGFGGYPGAGFGPGYGPGFGGYPGAGFGPGFGGGYPGPGAGFGGYGYPRPRPGVGFGPGPF